MTTWPANDAPLPCPFCGSEAHWGYDGDLDAPLGPCWVGCIDESCPAYPGATCPTHEEAMKLWNRRA